MNPFASQSSVHVLPFDGCRSQARGFDVDLNPQQCYVARNSCGTASRVLKPHTQVEHEQDINHSMRSTQSVKQLEQFETEDVVINLKVSLLELLQPKTQTLEVVRNRLCPKCDGHYSIDSNRQSHAQSQSQSPSVCCLCGGRGVFPDQKQFVFSIRGRQHLDRIVFAGEADQHPRSAAEQGQGQGLGVEAGSAGNIVVVLHQTPHCEFTRDGPHLFVKKRIVLLSALCGGRFVVQQLDGRLLAFSTRPGEVLQPFQLKCIAYEGMPSRQHPNDPRQRGHLFVQFEVEFPTQTLDPHTVQRLTRLLPPPAMDPLSELGRRQPQRVVQCEIMDVDRPKAHCGQNADADEEPCPECAQAQHCQQAQHYGQMQAQPQTHSHLHIGHQPIQQPHSQTPSMQQIPPFMHSQHHHHKG